MDVRQRAGEHPASRVQGDHPAHLLLDEVKGELYFAIGMSEPDSGSDLASVRTRASKTNEGWRVRGTKLWSSGAHRFSVALLRFDPKAEDPWMVEATKWPKGALRFAFYSFPEAHFVSRVREAAQQFDYVFVDPYDRTADFSASAVKTLSARGRVFDPPTAVDVHPQAPGSTPSPAETAAAVNRGAKNSISVNWSMANIQ